MELNSSQTPARAMITPLDFIFERPDYPPALYDESSVPEYSLPELMTTRSGGRVTDRGMWREVRRPEILALFAEHVYGRTPYGALPGMHWEVAANGEYVLDRSALKKNVVIYLTEKDEWPALCLNVTLPANVGRPVPVFLVPGWIRDARPLIERGYGALSFNPWMIEPDRKESAYRSGIRKHLDPPAKAQPDPEEWGSIGVWAWAASRAMDYIETDRRIDAKKVSIMGVSRLGKTVMWAGAQDERFAIVFSCQSGLGGAVIARRGFGETVKLINDYAPHWFNRRFKEYDDRAGDLPVDWHMLIALMAPRPVYISTAELDLWGDPHGSFIAAKSAQPAYDLYGREGLCASQEPPVETPVGDVVGYHKRRGDHGLSEYDWVQYLNFADRHFGRSA